MYALTGTYAPADLSPAAGTVEITPDVVSVAGDVVIVQQPVVAPLDDLGAISVEVVASDDPSWRLSDGQRMPYIIRENVTGLRRAWMAYLDGTGGDIADLVPLPEAPDMGSGYLTEAEGDARYQSLSGKGAPGGYVGLDASGRIAEETLHSPIITGVATAPTAPVNTAGDVLATLDYVIAQIAEQAAPAAPSAVREFLIYEAATAPTDGRLHIEVAGQVRTFRVAKVDADGVPYSLAPMLPGDTVTLTDDPDVPPILGWARYAVTGDVIDRGTYWEFPAARTDTSGSQTVTPGTRVRFIPTMAGGTTGGTLPMYEYAKVSDINSIGTLWLPVARLQIPSIVAGVYESGVAVEWVHGDAGIQAYFRISNDNGASWKSYTKENTMADEYQTFFYQFPVIRAAGPVDIRLEAKVSAGSMDINNADLWVRHVK